MWTGSFEEWKIEKKTSEILKVETVSSDGRMRRVYVKCISNPEGRQVSDTQARTSHVRSIPSVTQGSEPSKAYMECDTDAATKEKTRGDI